MEPNVPFKENVLQYRQNCYETTGHPLLSKAQQDLKEFQQELQIPFTANSEEQ